MMFVIIDRIMKVAYCTLYITQEFYCFCRYYVTANIITMEYDQSKKKPCNCFANDIITKVITLPNMTEVYTTILKIPLSISTHIRCSSSDISNVCCFVSVVFRLCT